MNPYGKKTIKPLVEARRAYALKLSYQIFNKKDLLIAVNAEADNRHWGKISRRQLFYDLEQAKFELYNRMSPEDKLIDWAKREAFIDQLEMLIETVTKHVDSHEMGNKETAAVLFFIFKVLKKNKEPEKEVQLFNS